MPPPSVAAASVAFLLIGAHFLRAGQFLPVGLAVLALGLTWLRREWVPWVLQWLLALATLEWVRTIASIAAVRVAAGRPALRMALVLTGVVAVTVLAAIAQRAPRARRWYGRVTP